MSELIDPARRAVESPNWRWMPGMRFIVDRFESGRIINESKYTMSTTRATYTLEDWRDRNAVPDLEDPATVGCMLALARQVCKDPALYVRLSDTTRQSDGVRAWEVLGWFDATMSPDGRAGSWRSWGHASEAEALVSVLEHAKKFKVH